MCLFAIILYTSKKVAYRASILLNIAILFFQSKKIYKEWKALLKIDCEMKF